MDRRQFLLASVSGICLSPFALAGAGDIPGRLSIRTLVFLDPRFPDAGAPWAVDHPGVPLIRVSSDVTAVWRSPVGPMARRLPLSLLGRTTESFHFCLLNLLRDHAVVRSEIQRLDRDLHRWEIHTVPRGAGGVIA